MSCDAKDRGFEVHDVFLKLAQIDEEYSKQLLAFQKEILTILKEKDLSVSEKEQLALYAENAAKKQKRADEEIMLFTETPPSFLTRVK